MPQPKDVEGQPESVNVSKHRQKTGKTEKHKKKDEVIEHWFFSFKKVSRVGPTNKRQMGPTKNKKKKKEVINLDEVYNYSNPLIWFKYDWCSMLLHYSQNLVDQIS